MICTSAVMICFEGCILNRKGAGRDTEQWIRPLVTSPAGSQLKISCTSANSIADVPNHGLGLLVIALTWASLIHVACFREDDLTTQG